LSYLTHGAGEQISRETLELLARIVGIDVPDGDAADLAEALRSQLASMEQIDRLDLRDAQPALRFDPRWHD
jgi:Asp-tRNA(Asn)/Glu-tRNA(Gln) amidotransferase C subunit